jgi:ribonuclease HI
MLKPIYSSLSNSKINDYININSFYNMNFDGFINDFSISSCGAVIYDKNYNEIWSGSLYIEENIKKIYSDYNGLILGLEKAIQFNIKNLVIRGSSDVVINQIIGNYKYKTSDILELYNIIKKLEKNFNTIKYLYVLDEYNKRANYLSKFID